MSELGLVLVLYLVVITAAPVLMMLSSAKDINTLHNEHANLLTMKQHAVGKEIYLNIPFERTARRAALESGALTPEAAQHLEEREARRLARISSAYRMLSTATRVIISDDEQNPIRILGFNASANLSRVLVSAGALLIALAVQQIVKG
jgi:hypothetical protein